MLEMTKVPKRQQRVVCMLFQKQLRDHQAHLRDAVKKISSACVEVMQSERLKRLLDIILVYGNELNQVFAAFTVCSMCLLCLLCVPYVHCVYSVFHVFTC